MSDERLTRQEIEALPVGSQIREPAGVRERIGAGWTTPGTPLVNREVHAGYLVQVGAALVRRGPEPVVGQPITLDQALTLPVGAVIQWGSRGNRGDQWQVVEGQRAFLLSIPSIEPKPISSLNWLSGVVNGVWILVTLDASTLELRQTGLLNDKQPTLAYYRAYVFGALRSAALRDLDEDQTEGITAALAEEGVTAPAWDIGIPLFGRDVWSRRVAGGEVVPSDVYADRLEDPVLLPLTEVPSHGTWLIVSSPVPLLAASDLSSSGGETDRLAIIELKNTLARVGNDLSISGVNEDGTARTEDHDGWCGAYMRAMQSIDVDITR